MTRLYTKRASTGEGMDPPHSGWFTAPTTRPEGRDDMIAQAFRTNENMGAVSSQEETPAMVAPILSPGLGLPPALERTFNPDQETDHVGGGLTNFAHELGVKAAAASFGVVPPPAPRPAPKPATVQAVNAKSETPQGTPLSIPPPSNVSTPQNAISQAAADSLHSNAMTHSQAFTTPAQKIGQFNFYVRPNNGVKPDAIMADNGEVTRGQNFKIEDPNRQVSKAFNDLKTIRNTDLLNDMGQAAIGVTSDNY